MYLFFVTILFYVIDIEIELTPCLKDGFSYRSAVVLVIGTCLRTFVVYIPMYPCIIVYCAVCVDAALDTIALSTRKVVIC